jgi:integrase
MNKGNDPMDLQRQQQQQEELQKQEQSQQQYQYQYQYQHQQKRIFDVTEGIRAKKTVVTYRRIFKHFLKHVKINDLEVLLDYSRNRPQIIKEMLIDYVLYLRDEKLGKKLARSSIKVHLAAVLHFFQINNDDFNLTMRHFRMHLPSDEFDYRNDDRAYSHKEISQILKACDVRVRMMILLLCSSGMRIGALCTLQIGDLIQIETTFNGLNLKVYKIQVYARTRDRYITFCSPECYAAIQEYLEYRRKSGETLNDKAPLIREQFNIDNPFTTNVPKPLSEHGVWYTVERAIKRSAVYDQCKEDGVHLSHGMRKFFKTQCEHVGMKSLHVEMLLGHNVGLASNYYRPPESDLLEDYMTHAADSLTIDPTFRLQKQVTRLETERTEEIVRLKAELTKLREESQESVTTIYEHNTKLYERDNDIAELKSAVAFLSDKVNAAIIANEPSSEVIFNQKGIPAIKITPVNKNTATAPLAEITEEKQESDTTTGTHSSLKESK